MRSFEKNKVNDELTPDNQWIELENIKNNILSKELNQESETKNNTNRNTDLLSLASRIKGIYDKKNGSDIEKQLENKNSGHSANEKMPISTKNNSPLLTVFYGKIADKYEHMNRPLIEEYKQEMRKNNFVHQYDMEYDMDYVKEYADPSPARKLFRLITNKIGTEPVKDKKERDIKNYQIAEREYNEEQRRQDAERIRQHEEDMRLTSEREQVYQRAEKERNDIHFQKQMAEIREQFDSRKKTNFQKQRELEILELKLNDRLLKIEELDAQVYAKNPEVQKRLIRYGTAEVPVYDLNGFPFSILSTNILYKLNSNHGKSPSYSLGENTALELMRNPAVWCLSRDQAIRRSGGFSNTDSYMTDTICTSFTNSETNLLSRHGSEGSVLELTYGFDQVSANSILNVSNSDGMTGSYGKAELIDFSLNIHSIDDLTSASGTSGYNEVTIRRYSENGAPKMPDYIITRNGDVDEYALKHAKFFNIPIININNTVYKKKMEERGNAILEKIYKEKSYPKIMAYIEELQSMSIYKEQIRLIETIGAFNATDSIKRGEMPYLERRNIIKNRFSNILKKEQLERLNFMRESLIKATSILEESTKNEVFNLSSEKFFTDISKYNIYL